MSLVGERNADWRTRKINLFSILRSFVFQLSPGQDLTKISLPSELCHPFSMMELIAYRELQLFHILFEINSKEDPLERFLIIVKWYMGMVREETIEKKPFNPVIGETHLCWVDHKKEEDAGVDSYSEFIGEQVSHHPPVTAFIVRNTKNDIKITGDVTFQVAFGTNYASVITGGQITIHTKKEKYNMSKCMPDMIVNNVVWGDKYIMWTGGINISCPDSGYSTYIELKEENQRNLISGQIFDGDKNVVFNIEGTAGEKCYLHKPESPEDKLLLVDITTYHDNVISYMPKEAQTELSSLKVWDPVKNAIIKNDMNKADETKKVIEADQRVRESAKKAAGLVNEGLYFYRIANEENVEEEKASINWIFRENIKLDEAWFEQMNKTVQEVREKGAIEADHEKSDEVSEKEDETCSVQ